MRALLDQLNHDYRVIQSDNRAYDISGFQDAAKSCPCEMMVFMGTTAYLRRPGWLNRMQDSFIRYGNAAIYVSTANQGDNLINVFPHIRTTGFWMSPVIMNMHPLRVTDPSHRYPYEHGPACLTQWCRDQGYKALMVTYEGVYEFPYWDSAPNGFHQGNQSALIVGDRLTAPPYFAFP